VIACRQSKTTGETLGENVVVTPFASADNGILAGSDPALHAKNTDNELDMKKGAVNRTMYRMGKVYDRLEMWQ